jgi:hypothetical protein
MLIIRVFSALLFFVGVILIVVALLSGVLSLVALSDRLQYGRGLLFADVEFFLLIALICGLPGVFLAFIARKLGRLKREDS